jgi:hypothetical protein
MKNLKIGIIACAAVCLAILFTLDIVEGLKHDTANAGAILVAYLAPLVVGIMGMTKPPFLQWQAIVSAAGFALALVKMRIWDTLPHIADAGAKGAIWMIATIAGLVISIMAISKPENAA